MSDGSAEAPDGSPTVSDNAAWSQGEPTAQDQHVLLLMQDHQDRRLLHDWLSQRYTVTAGQDVALLDQQFDLCMLDQPTFASHTDALLERKERAAPIFLPYLLLLNRQDLAAVEQRVWEYIDEVVATPIKKPELQGRLTGLFLRRNLSQALTEREKRIRQILQTIPDPLLIVDRDGTVVDANRAFEEYTGSDDGQLVGADLRSVAALPEETVAVLQRLATGEYDSVTAAKRGADVIDSDESATTDDGEFRATVTYRSPDGTVQYAEVGMARLPDLRNERPQTLFVLRDVTDRITRERALEHERDRLNNFADMLAHEVRNPLNIAQGFLDQVTPTDEREADAMDRVAASHTRMEQMIKELLAHARGDLTKNVQTLNLEQIARVAWGQTPTGDATLDLDCEEVTVDADPENFQTILENLFRNAMEHAGESPTVRIGVLPQGGFYVEDDGPGIAPVARKRIFERGYTTNSAGTGLGLSLVAQVAEAHGWELAATESEDGGARFEFRATAADED